MTYEELKRAFNVIIDIVPNADADPILEPEEYKRLTSAHQRLYSHNEYFIGITISYQIKNMVVEPMYVVNPVVRIDGSLFAVSVPSEEVQRISTILFEQWKQGGADYDTLFPNVEKL